MMTMNNLLLYGSFPLYHIIPLIHWILHCFDITRGLQIPFVVSRLDDRILWTVQRGPAVSRKKMMGCWANAGKVWKNAGKVWKHAGKVWKNAGKVWKNTGKVWKNAGKVWKNAGHCR